MAAVSAPLQTQLAKGQMALFPTRREPAAGRRDTSRSRSRSSCPRPPSGPSRKTAWQRPSPLLPDRRVDRIVRPRPGRGPRHPRAPLQKPPSASAGLDRPLGRPPSRRYPRLRATKRFIRRFKSLFSAEIAGFEPRRSLACSQRPFDVPDPFIAFFQELVDRRRRFLGVVVGQEHQIRHPFGGLSVLAFHSRPQQGFAIGKMLRIAGQKVLGVEHLFQGSLAPTQAFGGFFGSRFACAPLLPTQGQHAQLDMAAFNALGTVPQPVEVCIDSAVEIAGFGSLPRRARNRPMACVCNLASDSDIGT